MDAAGSEQAVLFGISEGGCMACLFAATYPERTRGLILWGTQARWVQSEDYPWGFPRDDHARIVAEMAEHGMTREYLTGAGAGMTDLDESEFDWLMRYFRAAGSPTQLAALEQMNRDMDIRAILPSIRVPTLVINRSDDPVVPIEAARALASGISTARLLEIPGSTHAWWGPGQDEIVAAMQEFVTGEPPAPRIDRVLATVLFTDIVGSTTKASELGDDRWRAVLAAHDTRAKAEIARYDGTYVHTTGDGLLATFDGPTRAVLCAQAIAKAMRPLGIQIRAGCHTGELELAGNDVQGIAVHIGARIAALAGAGEVLVSRTVRELSAGSPVTFDDRGSEHLKGVSEAWHLYAVRDV
jgi:class 3 adenylate cyclase